MHRFIATAALAAAIAIAVAPASASAQSEERASPYDIDLRFDLPVIGLGLAGTLLNLVEVAPSASTAIGLLKIEAGYHYWTDIVAGALVGTSVGALVPFLHTIR